MKSQKLLTQRQLDAVTVPRSYCSSDKPDVTNGVFTGPDGPVS